MNLPVLLGVIAACFNHLDHSMVAGCGNFVPSFGHQMVPCQLPKLVTPTVGIPNPNLSTSKVVQSFARLADRVDGAPRPTLNRFESKLFTLTLHSGQIL